MSGITYKWKNSFEKNLQTRKKSEIKISYSMRQNKIRRRKGNQN